MALELGARGRPSSDENGHEHRQYLFEVHVRTKLKSFNFLLCAPLLAAFFMSQLLVTPFKVFQAFPKFDGNMDCDTVRARGDGNFFESTIGVANV